MLTQISVPTDTKPTPKRATPLLSVLPTAQLLERLAELQVEAELEGKHDPAVASAFCAEIKNRLPEAAAGLTEFVWPDDEPSGSYMETLLIFAEAALDARAAYLAAA